MSIEFDDQQSTNMTFQSRKILGAKTTPKIIEWMMSAGIAKTEQQAGRFLISLTVLFFLISAYFIFKMNSSPTPPSAAELEYRMKILEKGPFFQ